MYIGDFGACLIRKVTASSGILSILAGSGSCTYTGDNGPATAAALSYPHGVALDSAGTHSSLLL